MNKPDLPPTRISLGRLSTKQIIAKRINDLYALKPDSYIFSDKYSAELIKTIERHEGWQFAIIALTIPLYLYLFSTVAGISTDITAWGIKIPQFTGLRISVMLLLSVLSFAVKYIQCTDYIKIDALEAIQSCLYSEDERYLLTLNTPDIFYGSKSTGTNVSSARYKQGLPSRSLWLIMLLMLSSVIGFVGVLLYIQLIIWISAFHEIVIGCNLQSFALGLTLAFTILTVVLKRFFNGYYEYTENPVQP